MNPPEIEPRILPLVEALNQTGLLETFSSCEGHFGDKDPDVLADREHAEVRFEVMDGVVESTLQVFFAHIYTVYTNGDQQWDAPLDIIKRFSPYWNEDGQLELEETYVLRISPFDRWWTPEEKRLRVDRALGLLEFAVRTFRSLPN